MFQTLLQAIFGKILSLSLFLRICCRFRMPFFLGALFPRLAVCRQAATTSHQFDRFRRSASSLRRLDTKLPNQFFGSIDDTTSASTRAWPISLDFALLYASSFLASAASAHRVLNKHCTSAFTRLIYPGMARYEAPDCFLRNVVQTRL